LYAPFADWVKQDRRFKAFAEAYQGKIRRKLRDAGSGDRLLDVQLEFSTAYTLLQERRFEVEYEKGGSKAGGPDFTVTYRANTPFSVEVRRLHLTGSASEGRARKLIETVCDKVWQMPPSRINVLLLASDGFGEGELAAAMAALRRLAERKAEDFFTRRGFKNAAEFLRQFRQLSLIVCKSPSGAVFWVNSLAKHPIPKEITLALQRLLG
jgi:hypothetical protein